MSRRSFVLVFTLLFNAFTWSYMIIMLMDSIANEAAVLSAFNMVFYISAAGAGLSGALLSEKTKRLPFLYLWMVLGLLSSSLLVFMDRIALMYLSVVFILLGISFGLGMPSSLAYLADSTKIENRGLISSLIFLAANVSVLPLGALFTFFDPVINSIVLVIWRGIGLTIFALLRPKDESLREENKSVSFISVIRFRPFSLYMTVWVMFSLIDAFERALLSDFLGSEFRSLLAVEPMIAVFFMFVGGLLADRIGRKHVAIYGFASLGIAYAVLSLAPTVRIAQYLYIVIDGVAAGIILTIFLLILWGDLSEHTTREKYYAIGSFPFLIGNIIPPLLSPIIASISATAAFSLASFFLFLAVLPLMYAPETLPQRKIEQRQLKGYVEQAKKTMEKYSSKNITKS